MGSGRVSSRRRRHARSERLALFFFFHSFTPSVFLFFVPLSFFILAFFYRKSNISRCVRGWSNYCMYQLIIPMVSYIIEGKGSSFTADERAENYWKSLFEIHKRRKSARVGSDLPVSPSPTSFSTSYIPSILSATLTLPPGSTWPSSVHRI